MIKTVILAKSRVWKRSSGQVFKLKFSFKCYGFIHNKTATE